MSDWLQKERSAMLLYIFLIIRIDFVTLTRSQKWIRDLSQTRNAETDLRSNYCSTEQFK